MNDFFQLTYVNLIRTQTEGFVYLLTCSCITESITYSESFTYLLTCVSSPYRHVTSVLTVLYDTDTRVIHLPTSELSSNTGVYANTLLFNLLTYLTYFTYLLTYLLTYLQAFADTA